ncbi:MAG: V-type ATP synthase subunit I [Thermoplasmata archaeon]|nr:V-type ATP synthase subunit I [Thermoplasmata archaeon]
MPFLRPLPFSKVAILGLNEDREVILAVLHDLGVLQVEPIGKDALEYLEPERASELQRHVADQLVRFRGLLAALPKSPVGAPFAFRNIDELSAAAKTIPIDSEVGRLKREEDQLTTERRSLEETTDLLARFAFFGGRYSDLSAKSAVALFGEGEADAVEDWRAAAPSLRSAPLVLHPADKNSVRFLLAVPSTEIESVTRLAAAHNVRLTSAPKLDGTAAEETPKLQARLAVVDQRLAEIHARLVELAKEWYPKVAALAEAFEIENRKLDVHSRLGTSRRAFDLEGWVPTRDLAQLKRTLLAAVNDRAEVFEVPTHEEPPTFIENRAGVRRFEFFIRFYSLPQATEWDPTIVFAIVFPIFFGLMLADWGYGLVILGFCVWMIANFPGRKYVPGPIKNFLKMIMAPSGMRSLAYALLPGCLLAIALGLVFNAFFGAAVIPGYHSPVDPIDHVGTYLVLAGYIGIAMVVFGFALGAIKEYFHHRYRHAAAKVGGIAATFGISLLGLGLIHSSFGNPLLLYGPLALVIAGALLFAIGEGAQQGIMGIIEVLSHVLSYTRLIGILLASVILATVINTISVGADGHGGLILGGGGIALLIFGIVILLMGQVFNVILGVFEPGIQGARLIFVEYFSKFYSGNGKEFKPLRSARTHTAPGSMNPGSLPPIPPRAVP